MTTSHPVQLAAFKNIVVTVTEVDGQLKIDCVEKITCTTADTIINFQITDRATPTHDYRFDQPKLSGDVEQLGAFTISPSGKMLTVCDSVSVASFINITLEVYDAKAAHKRGAFDPEVANQPDGAPERR